jgi:hypothetical protein
MFCCKKDDLNKCPQEFEEMMAGPLLQCANKQTQLTCNGGKTVMKELRKTRERDNPCYHIML